MVSQSTAAVSFFDAASDQYLGAVETLAEPHELCFDPVHRLLWCTQTYRSGFYHAHSGRRTELTVIDPDLRRVVEVVDLAPEQAPHGIALDAVRNRLYVSVEGSADRPGGVVVIDTGTRRPVGRIDSGAPGSHWVALDAAGRTACVANKEAPFVSLLDLERGTLTAKAGVPGSEGVAVSADGTRAFVAAPYNGSFAAPGDRPAPGIQVVDIESATVVDTLPAQDPVMPLHLTGAGLLLAGEVAVEPERRPGGVRMAPGRLTVFSAATGERLGGLEVGRCPLTITSSPDGRIAYVASYASGVVDVVDLRASERLARIKHAGFGETGTHGLAYIPRAA
ncbi:YncE family protein [Streptomyces sp. NPDC047017]|uniref:YncE family protein n=1 Tax=Streptomyces sp. NPDC047017 TaxID=3155024 RepID=UPI0033E2ADD0